MEVVLFMSDLSAFLAENVVKEEITEFVVSKRFLDSEGRPVAWKLKPVTAKMDASFRKSCTYQEPIPGKRGQYRERTDYDAYLTKLVAACVVFPNLNDSELQSSYGVMGAENLLTTMLKSGELSDLMYKVQEINGFENSFDDKVDEVKNA